MSKNNELAIFQQVSPLQVFQENKANDFLKGVKEEAEEFKKISDVSTSKGRAEIKSFAFKIAQTKAPLDKAGLSLTEEMRGKITLINAERSRIKDELQSLQDDVRQPLTDFENVEKERIQIREDRIEEMNSILAAIDDIDSIEGALKKLHLLIEFEWQEFGPRAQEVFMKMKLFYHEELDKTIKRNEQEEELAKLRIEKEERERKERETQIAKEATEKAERIAKEESERKAKIAEDEKLRLEAEKNAAEERIKQIEIQAKKDQEEAIIKERERVEIEKKREKEESEIRARNLAYKTKIYNEMISAISKFDTKEEKGCKALIKAIADGEVPHLTIKY